MTLDLNNCTLWKKDYTQCGVGVDEIGVGQQSLQVGRPATGPDMFEKTQSDGRMCRVFSFDLTCYVDVVGFLFS